MHRPDRKPDAAGRAFRSSVVCEGVMMTDYFLRLLDGVRKSGDGWLARCPGHDDGHASLSVREGEDGRILVKCHAGCSAESIAAARGLTLADLMPESPNSRRKSRPPIVATYDYRDADGTLLFQVCRNAEKGFSQRRPDGRGGWIRNLNGVKRVPYRLPELLATEPGRVVFVPEGEKDVDNFAKLGLVAMTSPGGAGKWRPEFAALLRGHPVVVLPDNDEPGRKHGEDVARSLHGVAASVRVLNLPGLPSNGDVSDWLARGGTREELERLAAEAPEWRPSTSLEIAGGPLSKLLDEITVFVCRFVVLTRAQADLIATWVLHTWAISAAEVTLFLSITSAEMRSGKTRLLEVLELLVRRPWRAVFPSEAVLYRKIELECPTLLLDEVDAVFGAKAKATEHEALRSLLNAGNRRGASVDRCVGKGDIRLQQFSVFCPRALAGIGRLPATVADRSLPIRLKRRLRSEEVERFRFRDAVPEAEGLRQRAEAWAGAAVERLRAMRPHVPDALDDRQADGAEPILTIADLAGGEWPDRVRRGLVELCAGEGMADDSLSVRLLRDVLTIFEVRRVDRLHSADLCEALAGLEEAPWGDYYGKPLKPRGLARLLEPFGVRSSQVKIDGRNRHGYARDDFRDAWNRYVPAQPGSETLPALPRAAALGFRAISETLPGTPSSAPQTGESSINTGTVAEVAFEPASGGVKPDPKTSAREACGFHVGEIADPCGRCSLPYREHLPPLAEGYL
jgi:hypothetical protein